MFRFMRERGGVKTQKSCKKHTKNGKNSSWGEKQTPLTHPPLHTGMIVICLKCILQFNPIAITTCKATFKANRH